MADYGWSDKHWESIEVAPKIIPVIEIRGRDAQGAIHEPMKFVSGGGGDDAHPPYAGWFVSRRIQT